ncbi:Mbov_0399 family ICE element protein [Mycoplasmopsis columbinasalis]|uniref:Mbov_0399 family ICE element protein n=1 Tax=Mycoplasmopsis columbinasalis TaxID=114880 RepID=UPI00101D86A6|nr:hypothetical protein [Mycoplasmopsis columbinasalis]
MKNELIANNSKFESFLGGNISTRNWNLPIQFANEPTNEEIFNKWISKWKENLTLSEGKNIRRELVIEKNSDNTVNLKIKKETRDNEPGSDWYSVGSIDLVKNFPLKFKRNAKGEEYFRIKSEMNADISLFSDTGGNLNTKKTENEKKELAQFGLENNLTKLEKHIKNLNTQYNFFEVVFAQKENSANNIYLYLKEKTNSTTIETREKTIAFQTNNAGIIVDIANSFEIIYGPYANFYDKSDIKIAKELPKVIEIPKKAETITDEKTNHSYLLLDNGTYKVYSPVSVKFTAKNDNFVLYVNGVQAEVYNNIFFVDLAEKDKDKIGKESKYVLEVRKYVNGSRNFPQDLESITRKTIIYKPKPFKVDIKWFGWNPDKNPDQKNLISRYLVDENGEVKRDGNGAALKNPNYDETIDPLTGTKKQLIWFKTNLYIDKPLNNSFLRLKNNLLHATYIGKAHNSSQLLYMKKTGLPYGSKFIFNNKKVDTPQTEWAGVIAEATVIGKGGSFVYGGDTKEIEIYKLNEISINNSTELYLDYAKKWINDDSRIVKIPSDENSFLISSNDEFFSQNGIYLFVSRGEDTISSFKFVLIQERDDEKNQNLIGSSFTDNIKSKQVQPLFESEIGKKFFAYLKNVLKVEYQLKTLSYEQCLVYFQKFLQYTEEQTKNNENDRVWIRPLFNHNLDNLYSRNEFKAKYEGNLNTLAKDIFADFAHKDKIAIQSFTIDNYRKNNVILDLIVTNPNLKYQLIANRVNFPIIFTDSNIGNEDEENIDTDPDIIYLEFDDEYIRTIEAPKYNVKSFIKTFNNKEPKRLWLKNLSRRSYEHINFENLTITKNDESQSVNITLKAELKPSAIALKKQLINQELHTTISYDLFGSGATGIFADIDIFTINLIGVSQDQIEARIKWVLAQQMPHLVYERDYRIVPDTLERIKAILNEPEANIRDANARSEDLSLEEKETEANFGKTLCRITLPVINTIYDLSKVSFPALDINAKYNVSTLNTEILKTYLNTHILDTTGLNYFDINDIVYTNFNQLQNALVQASQQNMPANFNIEFQGRTNSKVKNSNRFAVQYHGHYDKTYTDLSEIDLKLTYAENDRAKLTNAIYNEIVKTLNEKGIETKAYIPISKGLIALLVNELTPDDAELPVTITKEFFIKPNEPFGQNQGKVTITNTLNQKPIDNNQFLIDLSIVNFDLTYDENVLSKLEAQIIADIKAKMTNAYQLNETQYAINRHKLHKLIREIFDPNAKVKTKAFLIEPIENISENNGKVNITNTNTKPVNDDLPDIGEDPEEIAKKVFIKKVSYSVGGTVAFVTAFVLFVIWRKKRVRKIR